MRRFIERMATGRWLMFLFIAYSVVFGTILLTLNELASVSGGYGILDFERGYSSQRVMEILDSYGSEGMALSSRIQLLDMLNPALYSTIAAGLTYRLWVMRGPLWLAFVPYLAAVGDYLENITLFMITRSYPEVPDSLVAISSNLSLLKNGLIIVAFVPLSVGLIAWLWRKARA